MIHESLLDSRTPLVRCLEPASGVVPALNELTGWLRDERARLQLLLLEHGALLFRGFGVSNAAALEAFVRSLEPKPANYIEGNSPRTKLSSAVYTSTEYPAELPISLHNELSYAHWWPRRLYFCCEVPPVSAGETLLCDSRRILAALSGEVRGRFVDRGVLYAQNLPAKWGLGRSWPDAFETQDRAVVEDYLRAGQVDFRWQADGSLRTRQVREATRRHPDTGEEVWFNQADQWHISNLPAATRAQLMEFVREEDLPLHVSHGDGSAILEADLVAVRECCAAEALPLSWRTGDVLMLDNMRVAHGRRPFSGSRRILVAMA